MSEFEFPIERGHILQFLRAIDDSNPAFLKVGVAPPTFMMAGDHFDPDSPRRAKPGELPQIAVSGLGFHAEQHFTYHRHPRPGDVLTARSCDGARWEKEGSRGGHMVFSETITEYTDQSGEAVVTARWVTCKTERTER
jgi:hypothetical protein